MSPHRVVILSTGEIEPVYHEVGELHGPNDWSTVCGVHQRWIGWWHAFLPRRHADLFARPCRRCFP